MIKKLLASLTVASSFLIGTPGLVEARTPWIWVGRNTSGQSSYVRGITVDGNLRYFWADTPTSRDKRRSINCNTGERWFYGETNNWVSLGYYLPGTMGEAIYEAVCLGYRPTR